MNFCHEEKGDAMEIGVQCTLLRIQKKCFPFFGVKQPKCQSNMGQGVVSILKLKETPTQPGILADSVLLKLGDGDGVPHQAYREKRNLEHLWRRHALDSERQISVDQRRVQVSLCCRDLVSNRPWFDSILGFLQMWDVGQVTNRLKSQLPHWHSSTGHQSTFLVGLL